MIIERKHVCIYIRRECFRHHAAHVVIKTRVLSVIVCSSAFSLRKGPGRWLTQLDRGPVVLLMLLKISYLSSTHKDTPVLTYEIVRLPNIIVPHGHLQSLFGEVGIFDVVAEFLQRGKDEKISF